MGPHGPPHVARGPGVAAQAILKKSIFWIFHLGPLDPYKPPFNPINRPWDLSRSIELEKIFMIELSRASQRLSDARSCQNNAKIIYFGSGVAWSGSGLALFDPWISSMDIIHGYYPWIISVDIIRGYYTWKLSMDINHG